MLHLVTGSVCHQTFKANVLNYIYILKYTIVFDNYQQSINGAFNIEIALYELNGIC